MKPSQVTLQDVAERAGVHRSTVSLALRDAPRISPEVRERVQRIARELGYRVNPLVAALMQSRRSGRSTKDVVLAFVTSYPTREGWRPAKHDRPDFFPGAAARARDFGYRLEPFWCREPGISPRRFCDILTARGITGMIVGRLPPGLHTLELEWGRFSCVALGMTMREPRLHHVTENHFSTVSQAMQRCFERGYRRVGFVFSEANDSPRVGDRWLGAYLRHQLALPEKDRLPVCPGDPADSTTFAAWFRRTRPDAILATHHRPVLEWLQRLGAGVPEEVGVVDLENRPESPCAGIHYDPAKVGALAVEMLVGLMHRNETGVPADPHEVLLTGHWRDGNTLPRRT
ncbi:MAG: LacI family DNA-binding transcriptional regulator [Opitutaceae bacterium]|nr:LacI family DNA-binding transcriptional regulator [Opitutaceae bacterium]